MAKQSKATIRKRIATRKRNAARRMAMGKTGACPAVAAFDRLDADGASSVDNMRRRLQWLAHIWQISAEDLPEIKRTPNAELGGFIKKYGISCDWLLGGDLKGLHRMMHDHRERASGRPTRTERIMAKYHALTPDQQQIVDEAVNRILQERDPA